MKNDTIEKIEIEINQKTKLPNEKREEIRKEVFNNIMIGIAMIIYFTFLISGSIGVSKTVRAIDFNIFSIILLSVSIYLFEISYKKDNGKLALHGIEILLIAIITLFLPYIIFELDQLHKKYYMMISIYIAVYYIVKSIYLSQKKKNLYIKQMSDIKEIIKKEKIKTTKKEKPEEDSKNIKSNDDEILEHTKNKKRNEEKEIKNSKPKEILEKEIKKVEEKTQKKRGRPKKEIIKEEEPKKIEIDVNKTPKKRGRPKKIVDNEISKKTDSKTVQETPKKRGRPRKVVTTND